MELGRIVGLWGVRGWVKVESYTRDRAEICQYSPWLVGEGEAFESVDVAACRRHGPTVVACLTGYDDRTKAAALVGKTVAVPASALPSLGEGEYYWAQLEGLKVRNTEGLLLGVVSHLFETGANDVLVVQGERERLIPYIAEVVRKIDLANEVIEVDWDADF